MEWGKGMKRCHVALGRRVKKGLQRSETSLDWFFGYSNKAHETEPRTSNLQSRVPIALAGGKVLTDLWKHVSGISSPHGGQEAKRKALVPQCL